MSVVKCATICLTFPCALAIFADANIITVTNTNDNGPGSLRQALVDANDGDTIDATGVSGIITLTTGELVVDKSVTINGAGADVLAVDGNTSSRVFHIDFPSQTVTISGLTIRNGHTSTGGGIQNAGLGTTITNSTLSGNTANFGGGIFNAGTLTIVNSTLSTNMAFGDGGAVYNFDGNTLTITNSTFGDNVAVGTGGVCINDGMLQVANSTLSGNSAGFSCGGIFNDGTLQIGDTILNAGSSGANISNNGARLHHWATTSVAMMVAVFSMARAIKSTPIQC